MNRIDPKYYYKKKIEQRKRIAFEAFMFIGAITMITLSILIYLKHGC